MRDLLALPARHGELGIVNRATLSSPYYNASNLITSLLVSLIVSQDVILDVDVDVVTIEVSKTM